MFSRDFKRFIAVTALVLAGFAVSQYVFTADDAVWDAQRETVVPADVRDYPPSPSDYVRELNRSLNQEFDPGIRAEETAYDRDYDAYLLRREREFGDNARSDFIRDFRQDMRAVRERELRDRIDARRDARLSDESRILRERQLRADNEYRSRRQDLLGRMGTHPLGSTEYDRYNNELRRLEDRQLERQQELNDRMRDLQLLESTSSYNR